MAKNEKKPEHSVKLVCQNKKASHLYFIEDTIEAGLVLVGTEVKSLRLGHGSISEAFAQIRGGEAWIHQFHIHPYEQGNRNNVDPVRTRKLLMHRQELEKLGALATRKGYTIVPLKVYFANGHAKMLIGLARGKKQHDKREDIKQRDQKRDMERSLRGRG